MPQPLKTAVILLNLGGPDSPSSVRPFLFNLFHDPAIIQAAQPLRWFLAQLISRRRAPIAAKIYGALGGGSPLLPNTIAQAKALESKLGPSFKTFIAMRYWHPRAREQVKAVKAWGADRIILLPLYPQFSTTTTRSSVMEWERDAKWAGLKTPTTSLCCWPQQEGLISGTADLLAVELARSARPARVLFSAHGLPKRVVERGDPYQWQVEQTAAGIVKVINDQSLDWVVCYQSRVGPLQWIGPSVDEEVRRAGQDGVGLIVVPIAFVSEHSETLVELDQEYAHLAKENGVPFYHRVATVGVLAPFIDGLAQMVKSLPAKEFIKGSAGFCSSRDTRICPAEFGQCPLKE